MPQFKFIVVGLLALLLGACSSNDPIPDPDASQTVGGAGGMDEGNGSGLQPGEYFDDPNSPDGGELASILYFDFDSSELRPGDTEIVSRHAVQLGQNPGMQVRLEGHADERGSREYNIGLGERRAQTVRRLLMIQGASAAQISTVSFGEERPAVEGSDESAYAQNRRVEITYTN
ncbi:MAG: peptidoglycan-associated lipoprotein Pal [Gammaproteobacteria bacterium]|nr:peptidoglycan-associated lipoprotein Pal [Gammaproteobacteria bacterium]MDH5303678.1 peptidoglycan-associated lipoprotein Pal [Gammaproteobacteria bacterium]MDH5323600.1 peptidoglycan-associated lipoprotein Pal [Gammaproteobacteria bacterium]